jgi:hypothetical protein
VRVGILTLSMQGHSFSPIRGSINGSPSFTKADASIPSFSYGNMFVSSLVVATHSSLDSS